MLARAARPKLNTRRHASRYLNSNLEHPLSPWPSSIRLRWLVRPSLGSQLQTSEDSKRPCPHLTLATTPSRSLATTTDFHPSTSGPVPFLSTVPVQPSRSASKASPSNNLPPWGSFNPLVIREQLAEQPSPMSAVNGIGGDSAELFQNLHASLVVGRYERSEAIVRRLQILFVPSAPELLEAHKIYIRALLDGLAIGRQSASLKKIQRWFEVEVRRTGVQPDPTLLALMCRASFIALEGPPRVRTIRRYLHFAEELGILDPTMASGEYLYVEWRELLRIRDDLFAASADEAAAPPLITEHGNPLRTQVSDPLPPIRPMEQKGLGLQTLRKSLFSLERAEQVPYPHDMEATPEEKEQEWNLRRQLRLEEDVCEAALEQWRAEHAQMLKMGINTSLKSKPVNALLYEWHTGLQRLIEEELANIKKTLNKYEGVATSPNTDRKRKREAQVADRLYYGPYLESVSSEKIAAHTLMAVMDGIMTETGLHEAMMDGVYLLKLASAIGSRLEAESNARNERRFKHSKRLTKRLAQHRRQMIRKISKTATFEHTSKVSREQKPVPPRGEKSLQEVLFEWPAAVKVQIGALLTAKLIEVAKIQPSETARDPNGPPAFEPAFKHDRITRKGRRIGVVMPHKALLAKMQREPVASIIAAKLPMLVPPVPWQGFKVGGYLRQATPVVRLKDDDTQAIYARAAADRGDLDQVFAGLDILGRTGWRINRDVLKVMLEAWNSGEAIGAIPPENPEITYPPEPDPSEGPRAKYQWRIDCKILDDERAGYHSQRCFFNLQLEIARAFVDDVFYCPHNIDFRGRAYPVPPYLNHMGADNARGLLKFADGKELGPTGLKWLKVHLANVSGYDKASLSDREEFAMSHMDDVVDSATDPLGGKRWWLTAEDPWQCLAACFELKHALGSPDPTKFVSHLAVHQDGTCNGLQHYAALGGDAFGASQVNLEPGDRPADVYTGVADLVKVAIDKDAEAGSEIAKALQGKITRKVVKQTVMTNVYGVTYVGARKQVEKQLDDIMRSGSECGFHNHALAGFIARKIFAALAEMFQGAQAIQRWLGECAGRISTTITPEQVAKISAAAAGKARELDPKYNAQHFGALRSNRKANRLEAAKKMIPEFRSTVIWTTPLKLPVVQPYRGRRYKDIRTALQLVSIASPTSGAAVVKRKQLQAFPPNFIHSLDATHMLLSALKCDEVGLTFAAVHDSFWTHAADVPVMNRILRDAFVRMHTEDVIGRLAAEFAARYKGSMYLASVEVASAVGKKIRKLRRLAAEKQDGPARNGRMGPIRARKIRAGARLITELLAECERQKMLLADDVETRRKGEEMVTPASLVLAAKPDELGSSEKLEASTLGAVPEGITEMHESSTVGEEELDEDHDDDYESGVEALHGETIVEADELSQEEPADMPTEPASSTTKKSPRKAKDKMMKVWLPLTIPKVPRRGDWDISRLRQSTYFFS